MNYYCNPINVVYHYQFNMDLRAQGKLQIDREAADPSMIQFKGKYYLFPSMNLSVWVSEDLVNWSAYPLPENLPLYDYAPDVRVNGEYVYFSASKKGEVCNFYRTKNIIEGPYEEILGTFEFWDPNLFFDEDGRVYFYWGCSNATPLWGVELDPLTMTQKTKPIALIDGNPYENGYERMGIDHCEFPRSEEVVEQLFQEFLVQSKTSKDQLPKQYIPQIRGMFTKKPYIEGAWMDKYKGKYYLQYACPGAEYHTYADGVYVSDSPLGPFVLGTNNPFSYHPGGFMPGAGHGSTMWDKANNLWHTSTMRISVNHQFERRVGIWPAGFDRDGELFCNQQYGDWPIAVSEVNQDPWSDPKWYLLSYAKPAKASSQAQKKGAELVVNEDATNWWQAAEKSSFPWIEIDLEKAMDVRGIQINFADDALSIPSPKEIKGAATQPRYIEERELKTRWILEGSLDQQSYFIIEDKSEVDTDLAHDFIVREKGISVRYVRLTIIQVPYEVAPCISGLRVFGIGTQEKAKVPAFQLKRSDDNLDMLVTIEENRDAVGYNILWGHEKEKLYHSYQIYRDTESVKSKNEKEIQKRIGALIKDQNYFVRVDSYNENGITKGEVKPL